MKSAGDARFSQLRRSVLLFLISSLYIVSACFLASQKLFWNDELYTLHFAQIPTFAALCAALGTGADQIPPTFVLLTKIFVSLFGVNHISLRFPEILGFFIMTLCLYKIVSARLPATYGFLAMLLPMLTEAFKYAYEARPYAVVLGFSAIAFLCWQSAVANTRRNFYLLGLTFGLAGTYLSHYYGILAFVPLIIGEVFRTYSKRRIDLSIWIAFLVALMPLLLLVPLIRGASLYGSTFWAKPDWSQILIFYDFLLHPIALIVTLIFSVVLVFHKTQLESDSIDSRKTFHSHELVAAGTFLILPALAVTVAKTITGAFTYRHVLWTVMGFSIIIPYCIHLLFGRDGRSKVILAVFIAGFFIRVAVDRDDCLDEATSQSQAVQFLKENAVENLPIVSWFTKPAYAIWYYGPTNLGNRIFYLADANQSLRYMGQNTVDRGLIALKPWFPIKNVQMYQNFINSHPEFYLYNISWGNDWEWNWIISALLASNMHMTLVAKNGNAMLFLVTAR